jgi:hypothetical protein
MSDAAVPQQTVARRTSSFLRKHLTLYFVFRCGPSALTKNDSGVR